MALSLFHGFGYPKWWAILGGLVLLGSQLWSPAGAGQLQGLSLAPPVRCAERFGSEISVRPSGVPPACFTVQRGDAEAAAAIGADQLVVVWKEGGGSLLDAERGDEQPGRGVRGKA